MPSIATALFIRAMGRKRIRASSCGARGAARLSRLRVVFFNVVWEFILLSYFSLARFVLNVVLPFAARVVLVAGHETVVLQKLALDTTVSPGRFVFRLGEPRESEVYGKLHLELVFCGGSRAHLGDKPHAAFRNFCGIKHPSDHFCE
jgi:hypothetical protein